MVANPDRIANAVGMDGLDFMEKDAKNTPMRFYFTAPSNVPPTHLEGMGPMIAWKEVRELLSKKEYVALGEVIDPKAVTSDEPGSISKIEMARTSGKPIDGQCPGLSGYELDRYIMSGITTDLECTTIEEAEEKHRKGLRIIVREGSGSNDLSKLMQFAIKNKHFLATNEIAVSDLVKGHVNLILEKRSQAAWTPCMP